MTTKRYIPADPPFNPFPIIVTTDESGMEWVRHASAPSLSALGGSIRVGELAEAWTKQAKSKITAKSRRGRRRQRGRGL